jgi:hypothetical protein
MNEKYYTPLIEEFYVGFEFEYNEKGAWHNVVCEASNCYGVYFGLYGQGKGLYEMLDCEDLTYTRVKYLDEADIEECGWISRNDGITYELGDCVLGLFDTNRVMIESVGEIDGTLFDGTIKNKSELKKIMQMVGIK